MLINLAELLVTKKAHHDNAIEKGRNPPFLSGWKEIANHMGKGVRTVQRYEQELGLPVRRPAGRPWGSVIATRAEIDGWIQASPIRDAYHLPSNDSGREHSQTTKAIKEGLAEMNRLREQMFELRSEVIKSIHVLRSGLVDLQNGLTQSQLMGKLKGHNPSTLYSIDEGDSLDRSDTDFPSAPTNHPKAS